MSGAAVDCDGNCMRLAPSVSSCVVQSRVHRGSEDLGLGLRVPGNDRITNPLFFFTLDEDEEKGREFSGTVIFTV